MAIIRDIFDSVWMRRSAAARLTWLIIWGTVMTVPYRVMTGVRAAVCIMTGDFAMATMITATMNRAVV